MAITDEEARLRIIEVLVPTCSKAQLTDPEQIEKIATSLEDYVLGTRQKAEVPSPRKGKKAGRKAAQPGDPFS